MLEAVLIQRFDQIRTLAQQIAQYFDKRRERRHLGIFVARSQDEQVLRTSGSRRGARLDFPMPGSPLSSTIRH